MKALLALMGSPIGRYGAATLAGMGIGIFIARFFLGITIGTLENKVQAEVLEKDRHKALVERCREANARTGTVVEELTTANQKVRQELAFWVERSRETEAWAMRLRGDKEQLQGTLEALEAQRGGGCADETVPSVILQELQR